VRIKEIFQKEYKVKSPKKLHAFFYQPSVLKPLFDFADFQEDEFDEQGNYIYGDGLNTVLTKTYEHYGDPLYSLSSYFTHFEDPKDPENDNDWLLAGRIDTVTTTFELKKDTILLENRYFKDEVGLWLKNNVDPRIHASQLNIREMFQLVSRLYPESKIKKTANLKWDVENKKMVNTQRRRGQNAASSGSTSTHRKTKKKRAAVKK
jgi:hypothetical protein